MKLQSKRGAARALGHATYNGKHCYADGTYERYVETGKCVQCEVYRRNVAALNIVGEDNRTEAQKQQGVKVRHTGRDRSEGWSDEMREAHSSAVKRGLQRTGANSRTISEAEHERRSQAAKESWKLRRKRFGGTGMGNER